MLTGRTLVFVTFTILITNLTAHYSDNDCTTRHEGSGKEDTLTSIFQEAYVSNTTYVAPPSGHLDSSQALFESLLRTKKVSNLAETVDAWDSIGLRFRLITQGNTEYAVIYEFPPSAGTGKGLYVIKLSPLAGNLVLEAPHRPSDLYTHEIVFEILLSDDQVGAAAWSTTHRNVVDLGKEPFSFFNAFTIAAALAHGNSAKVLQLHGFSKGSMEVNVDIIYSSTKLLLPEEFEATAECLKDQLPGNIVLLKYPKEISELGGTLNINARKFYEANPEAMFFHVETSKELRDELRINPDLRLKFGNCFH